MTDEHRPAPQYGEYATPEEVARLRGPAQPEPIAPRPDPVTPQSHPELSPAERRRRAWDLPVTGGLLVLGFVLTLQSLPGFLEFGSTLSAAFAVSGVAIEFGADANAAGITLFFVHCVLFLAALGVSVFRLRAGRLAYWVPLTAGALAVLADIVIPLVLILSDPAYTALLLNRP